MQKETSPYICHVFVCTNDRRGERKSCADGGGKRTPSRLSIMDESDPGGGFGAGRNP